MSRWILLLVLCSRYCQNAAISCGSREYEKDGKCCSMCKPGQKLGKKCTESNETVCVSCGEGEYHDDYNQDSSCRIHKDCVENLGFQMISEGTVEKDVKCVCVDGKHCSTLACETCVSNKNCSSGHGVIHKADRYSDTKCEKCPNGTFSNVTSYTEPCKKWQSCTSPQQVIRPGTANTDVVCGPRPKNSTWIYIVVCVIVLIIGLAVFYFIRRRQRVMKVKVTQEKPNAPKKDIEDPTQLQLNLPVEHAFLLPNLPEEDQDITMQGLPVAQEQGKDYHMAQQEDV